jgi:hypothetical protein
VLVIETERSRIDYDDEDEDDLVERELRSLERFVAQDLRTSPWRIEQLLRNSQPIQ